MDRDVFGETQIKVLPRLDFDAMHQNPEKCLNQCFMLAGDQEAVFAPISAGCCEAEIADTVVPS